MSDFQQQDPSNPDKSEEAEVKIGPFSIRGSVLFLKKVWKEINALLRKLKFLFISLLIMGLLVLYLLNEIGVIKEYIDPVAHSTRMKQIEFSRNYKDIESIIERFDEYSGYDPVSQNGQVRIKPDNLKGIKLDLENAISLFVNNPPTDFSPEYKSWYYHLKALMYLINGALFNDKLSILIANNDINKAQKIQLALLEYEKDDKTEHKKNLDSIIKDKLIILVFVYLIDNKVASIEEARLLLSDLGGCDYLLTQSVKNLRVYSPLGCDTPSYLAELTPEQKTITETTPR